MIMGMTMMMRRKIIMKIMTLIMMIMKLMMIYGDIDFDCAEDSAILPSKSSENEVRVSTKVCIFYSF